MKRGGGGGARGLGDGHRGGEFCHRLWEPRDLRSHWSSLDIHFLVCEEEEIIGCEP